MRQLIVKTNQDKNGLVVLDGKDFHYLRQVLRVKTGDMVNVCLPDGCLYESTVCKIDDKCKKITLQVCGVVREPYQPHVVPEALEGPTNEIDFSLFQFIPKPQKLDLIVRQATECGVKNIIPVISEYAEKGSIAALQKGKLDRLERIIREARQQSGSPTDTKIFEPVTVEQAIELWNEMKKEAGGEEKAAGFVLSERAVSAVPDQKSAVPDQKSAVPEALEGPFDKLRDPSDSEAASHPDVVCIFCGNEGGISPEELELLTKKALLQPVHFSVNILRCETAALYGIAAIQTNIFGF